MWKKINEFIFVNQIHPESVYQEHSPDKITERALAHYCDLCDRGFKTVGARNAHKKLKHGI